MLRSALLRMYPRAWRRRYAHEMEDLVARQKLTARAIADLVAGAVDARLNPQWTPRVEAMEGDRVRSMFRCAPAGVTMADQWRSAAWMIGGSIVLTLFGILLKLQIGPNSLSDGLVYAAFPASLMLSSECTYLKRYSPAARSTMAIGGALLIILMMWASVAIGHRI